MKWVVEYLIDSTWEPTLTIYMVTLHYDSPWSRKAWTCTMLFITIDREGKRPTGWSSRIVSHCMRFGNTSSYFAGASYKLGCTSQLGWRLVTPARRAGEVPSRWSSWRKGSYMEGRSHWRGINEHLFSHPLHLHVFTISLSVAQIESAPGIASADPASVSEEGVSEVAQFTKQCMRAFIASATANHGSEFEGWLVGEVIESTAHAYVVLLYIFSDLLII